jgi:hypothetical protein
MVLDTLQNPVIGEHEWLGGGDPIDEHYSTHQNLPGVRIRVYETGEQPGIHEVLSPELAVIAATNSQTRNRSPSLPQAGERSTKSTQESSRAPRIFTAMAEAAEREKEDERAKGRTTARSVGRENGSGHGSFSHRRVASALG